jgi:hypothetical protein
MDWPTVVNKALDHWWVLLIAESLVLAHNRWALRHTLDKIGKRPVYVRWRLVPPQLEIKSDGPHTAEPEPRTKTEKAGTGGGDGAAETNQTGRPRKNREHQHHACPNPERSSSGSPTTLGH